MSLVPYTPALSALQFAAAHKRELDAVLQGAPVMYNYTKAGLRAGKKITNWARKRTRTAKRRRVGKQIGQKVGSNTSKRHETGLPNTIVADRTLESNELTLPPHTTSNSINSRQRDMINLRGFKICMEYQNIQTSGAELYLNIAVVAPTTDPNGALFSTADFFRAPGSTRGDNFNILTKSIDYHCYPLNTDRMRVYCHDRIHVGSKTLESNRPLGGTWMKYVPINRQIRFDDATPMQRFWLLVWFTRPHQNTATATASCAQFSFNSICFYKEPCVC